MKFKNEKPITTLDDSGWDIQWKADTLKSERRAWFVAAGFGVAFGVSVAGSLLMPPKVVQVPYTIRVNETTGVVDLLTSLDGKIDITPTDALDKANLSAFVKAREGYQFYNLQSPYNLVAAMAGEKVGAEYTALYSGDFARDKVWRDSVSIDIEILSAVPTGETGTVRFKKTTRKDGQTAESIHAATLSYGYYSTAKSLESVRLLNPLGFRVMFYRVDDELGGGL